MSNHTPGEWVDSPHTSDAIISTHPDAVADAGVCNDYYGGYVICESITPRDKPLLKAAPDLLEACEAVLDELGKGTTSGRGGFSLLENKRCQDILRAALAKVEGSEVTS